MEKQRATRTRYPSELKERAVRMARDLQLANPRDKNVISRVARQLGVGVNRYGSGSSRRHISIGAVASPEI
jgi:transposase-like protein